MSRMRRFATALLALSLSAAILHAQIADALVLRGDALLYRHQMQHAKELYRRALLFDASSPAGADRFVFVAMQQRTLRSLAEAIDVATQYLRRQPSNVTIRGDRALCYLIEHRYARALTDFENLARAGHDPRSAVFAGWSALHAGERALAFVWWKRALRWAPSYRPALDALEAQRR